MGRWDRLLRLMLRVTGTMAALALVAVVMPRAWMADSHARLGLGPLPEGPIVEYLARSVSLFYALFGLVLWGFSFDVRGYGRAIGTVAGAMCAFGVVLFFIDLSAGMPGWWVTVEGPFVVLLGLVFLLLRAKARRGRFFM